MNHNQTNINTYNAEFEVYATNTASVVTGSVKEFIDCFLSHIDTNASILEIGSGTGRDAAYIEDNGYTILRTDAAPNFVAYMGERGVDATVLDIVNEQLNKTFDAVFADAVFLHFDEDDLGNAMQNTLAMLKKDGILALSFHKGDFRGISDHKHTARYFHEWQEQELLEFLGQFTVNVLDTLHGESISKRKKWIMVTLQKTR